MHLSTSIGTGKAPRDLAALRVAFAGQGFPVLPQMIQAFDACGQTPSLNNADLDLGYGEPTAMLRRSMDLQPFPETLPQEETPRRDGSPEEDGDGPSPDE